MPEHFSASGIFLINKTVGIKAFQQPDIKQRDKPQGGGSIAGCYCNSIVDKKNKIQICYSWERYLINKNDIEIPFHDFCWLF